MTEDPKYVKAAEGYAGAKLRKRGIKVCERLAIMRAKLWHREAYDYGTDPCLEERYAGAWCQAGLVDDDNDGAVNTQMVSTLAWDSNALQSGLMTPASRRIAHRRVLMMSQLRMECFRMHSRTPWQRSAPSERDQRPR